MEQFLKPIHLVCVKDGAPNMSLIEIFSGVAIATNGNILVTIDLKKTSPSIADEFINAIEGKFIHMEVWKEIWKCDELEADDANIYCWKNGIKKTFEYAEPNGEFFKITSLINEIKLNGEEAKKVIAFNPYFIAIIAKIFQETSLVFSFSKEYRGTVVFPSYDSGMSAILMPVMLMEEARYFVV
jgi:hypothetical protein